MDLILQLWGGCFYLCNKLLLAASLGKKDPIKRQLKVSGWIIYLLGVPAWVIILVSQKNWIATSIEVGAVPAMLLGLYYAYKDQPNKLFDKLVGYCVYTSLAIGLFYSLSVNRGINSFTQILELGIMLGFLVGSYLMAKNRLSGWLYLMLMNLCTAALMHIENKPILMVQQLMSLCIVIYGFNKNRQIENSLD